MAFIPAQKATVQGDLHFLPPNLSYFEPSRPAAVSDDTNTLIWIGGLNDTYLSVEYPLWVTEGLPSSWCMAFACLTSSGHGWGVSSIARDAEELAQIVTDVKDRRPRGKVVIMGHSTGCQDCMEYLVGEEADTRPAVEGVIFQAPVSDRQAIEHVLPRMFVDDANKYALRKRLERKEGEAMPPTYTQRLFGRTLVTVSRWLAIASPGPDHEGADDFFTSTLPDERLEGTFGRLPAGTPALILFSGEEENVPPKLDKEKLVRRWTKIAKSGGAVIDEANGGILPGASHNLNGNPKSVVEDLVRRVSAFVHRIEKTEFARPDSRI